MIISALKHERETLDKRLTQAQQTLLSFQSTQETLRSQL